MSKPFTRARRRTNPAPPYVRLEIASRLRADPRYLSMPVSSRYVLHVAVVAFMDADGKWWNPIESEDPNKLSWTKATGCSRSTVKRAIREAESAGLLTRDRYLRPDGTEGTSTYWLDERLVYRPGAQGRSQETRLVAPPTAPPPTSWASGDPAPTGVNVEPPEQEGNGEEPLYNDECVDRESHVDLSSNDIELLGTASLDEIARRYAPEADIAAQPGLGGGVTESAARARLSE